jgi:hypothetical protein
MEFIIALTLFALIIVAWTMLPGTGAAALTVEETTTWTGTEVTAAAKA